MNASFRAMIVEETPEGGVTRRVGTRQVVELPPGDVLIRVRYSALNFKDALSATGNRGITRRYPHTPGVDAAGVVEASTDPAFAKGAEVIVTGYDLGMNTAGGFGEYIRVPAGWVVPRPAGLTLREAMALGTAGLTAALAVEALQDGGVAPGSGPVLVTGATGGVGSLAVSMLARAGYAVTAATGKGDRHAYLKELGAAEVIGREAVLGPADRALLSSRWGGVVDTVGGVYLDAALRATRRAGVVAACGMVAAARLETNIFPFILRGVRLQGIDTAETPMPKRRAMWVKLAGSWKPEGLAAMCEEVTLDGLDPYITRILAGQVAGRIVVKHS